MYCFSKSVSASITESKQSTESKQTADIIRIPEFSYLSTLYNMSWVKSVEILNLLNFGDEDDDEKWLVGLRQASGRRQKFDKLHYLLNMVGTPCN